MRRRRTFGTMVTLIAVAVLASAAPAAAVPTATSTGSGTYALLGTTPTVFEYAAIRRPSGGATGALFVATTFQGFPIEFEGDVTCVTFDAANHRAWIGGVITANRSTHPSFTTPRTQVGHDIWFRVVDYGEGAAAPADRATFVGFEGDLEIPDSPTYCALQPWAPDDARTWEVTEGNIQVRD
jgi:hypothetical protein